MGEKPLRLKKEGQNPQIFLDTCSINIFSVLLNDSLGKRASNQQWLVTWTNYLVSSIPSNPDSILSFNYKQIHICNLIFILSFQWSLFCRKKQFISTDTCWAYPIAQVLRQKQNKQYCVLNWVNTKEKESRHKEIGLVKTMCKDENCNSVEIYRTLSRHNFSCRSFMLHVASFSFLLLLYFHLQVIEFAGNLSIEQLDSYSKFMVLVR